ncbi:MAG TPA: PspC domain-containing protein [Acidimicrobiales bacterium]|nr:PspC domain-containing protein [Acidimicrobiales bacterium]
MRGITDTTDPATRPAPAPPGPDASRVSSSGGLGNASWDSYGWRGHGHRHRHHPLRLRIRGPIKRSSASRVLGGVCGGLSECTGIDVTLVRIGFVLVGMMSGVLVLGYAIAWLVLPIDNETSNIFSRAVNDRRGIRLVIAFLPVIVAIQIVVSVLHIGYLGFIGWPVFLAVALGILIWRNASEHERVWISDDVVPIFSSGSGRHGRWTMILRLAVGLAMTTGGVLVLVLGHTTTAALRPVGGALLVVAAIVVVLGPWWLSLARDLMAERQARALAEERAQMAAHVHDSVLQTLALIQRSSDDPQNVLRLARAQERELRAWLFEGRPPGTISEDATMLGEGIGLLQRQVEANHGIAVHVVLVGECELSDALRALLDAAREATVNAAKWSGADQVSLYCEVEPDTVMLFVRDRGQGFDPDAVPTDRQGIAQSIRARMARFGGTVVIRSEPGAGAEVELSMPRRQLVR